MNDSAPDTAIEALKRAVEATRRARSRTGQASGTHDQPKARIQGEGEVHTYVLPLAISRVTPSEGSRPYGVKIEVDSIEGTGFLVANGRGLGITARHVAVAPHLGRKSVHMAF